jgi:hypothetical protein
VRRFVTAVRGALAALTTGTFPVFVHGGQVAADDG